MRKGSGASGGVRSRRSEEGQRGARKSRECAAGRGVRASASSLPAARARAGMPAVGMNPFIRTSSSGAAMNCRVPGLASDGSVRPTVGILQQAFRRKKDQFPREERRRQKRIERKGARAQGRRPKRRERRGAKAQGRKETAANWGSPEFSGGQSVQLNHLCVPAPWRLCVPSLSACVPASWRHCVPFLSIPSGSACFSGVFFVLLGWGGALASLEPARRQGTDKTVCPRGRNIPTKPPRCSARNIRPIPFFRA